MHTTIEKTKGSFDAGLNENWILNLSETTIPVRELLVQNFVKVHTIQKKAFLKLPGLQVFVKL